MSDTPKFTVIDRRKFKAEEEHETAQTPAPATEATPAEPSAGPRLVVTESRKEPVAESAPESAIESELEQELAGEMPPAPSAAESKEQKIAYDAAAQRLEDIIRAQNPGMGAQPPVGFEHLVQQLYMSAMIQMGAGTQDGQRPRVDILGARGTIDMLGVLADKVHGNLSETEQRLLESVLFEVRMAFLELTSMISLQAMQPPQPPPPGMKR
jgi:hypothetical protein